MKKHLIIVIAAVLGLMTLSSCETTNVYPNTSKSFIYTVNANQWVDHEFWFSHTLNLPELTDYYVKQGNVSVAISFNDEDSYTILPATFDGVSYWVNYSQGQVIIYGEDPLFDEDILIPIPQERVTVKIVLTETDYIE